jgi:hypothetical protein
MQYMVGIEEDKGFWAGSIPTSLSRARCGMECRDAEPGPILPERSSLENWAPDQQRTRQPHPLGPKCTSPRAALHPGHESASPRHALPESCSDIPPKLRGRRESRALAAPAASCAVKEAHELSYYR